MCWKTDVHLINDPAYNYMKEEDVIAWLLF